MILQPAGLVPVLHADQQREGIWIPGLSAGIGLGPTNLTAGIGATLPVDGDAESSVFFYGLQLALPLGGRFTPFVGLNGLH